MSEKFGSISMYPGFEPGEDDDADHDGDRGESLFLDDDELSEPPAEGEKDENESSEYSREEAVPNADDAPNADDLAVALQAARQEAESAQLRAQQYEEQLVHIAAKLQRPAHTTSYDALSESDVDHWESVAATRGSDPRTEYRLHQEREDNRLAFEQATLGESIRGYFNGHADHSEYGAAVMKMLEADPVNLTPFLPPSHALKDAAWRIDAMFEKAKLARLVAAKKEAAVKANDAAAGAQRAAMKAATRGEPTRQSGVNTDVGDPSKSSRRTPADEMRESLRREAAKQYNLLKPRKR